MDSVETLDPVEVLPCWRWRNGLLPLHYCHIVLCGKGRARSERGCERREGGEREVVRGGNKREEEANQCAPINSLIMNF